MSQADDNGGGESGGEGAGGDDGEGGDSGGESSAAHPPSHAARSSSVRWGGERGCSAERACLRVTIVIRMDLGRGLGGSRATSEETAEKTAALQRRNGQQQVALPGTPTLG